jgi:hypothetical protein
MITADEEHPAIAAWRALSEQTLQAIDPASLPGQSTHQAALRHLFLVQRLDYHRAVFMYHRLERAKGTTH